MIIGLKRKPGTQADSEQEHEPRPGRRAAPAAVAQARREPTEDHNHVMLAGHFSA